MLDLNSELNIVELIPLQAATATVTGASKAVNTLNTGDLDMASLNIIALAGNDGTHGVTVALQQSADGSTNWLPIPTDPIMPATSFAKVVVNMTVPVTIPIDPRGIGPFIRAVATFDSGVTAATIELQLFSRKLQQGFGTTSG